jgi:thiamine biosynthesis lipoprotein
MRVPLGEKMMTNSHNVDKTSLAQRWILIRTSLLALLLAFSGACHRDTPPAQTTWMCMGTFCSVSVPRRDQANLDACVARAQAIMQDINDRVTVYTNTSEIAALNRSAGHTPVPVSDITRELLHLSKEYACATDGAFDVTVGPLVRAWGFNTGTPPPAVLEEKSIADALAQIGQRFIVVDEETAFLTQASTEVDLGGIAKGYAVDRCYDELVNTIPGGIMVNIGGNLRCGGNARPGKPWTVGVRHPLQRDALLGTLTMTDGMAIATSGNYERFVTIGGERYAHIIDPRTGHPVQGMAGVTVLCRSATRADALSTALFVLGIEASKPVLAAYPDVEALFVPDTEPMQIFITPGFAKAFRPLDSYANAVTIMKK